MRCMLQAAAVKEEKTQCMPLQADGAVMISWSRSSQPVVRNIAHDLQRPSSPVPLPPPQYLGWGGDGVGMSGGGYIQWYL